MENDCCNIINTYSYRSGLFCDETLCRVSEDSGEVIKIESNGKVTLTDEDKKSFETVQSEVDTKTKVFTIHTEDTQAEGLLSGTYDYSIEKDTLTLTEREYGDQLVFVKREKK